MEIVDYTEKSLVIKGEKTREYKENLKELGGKFNASLKCGAGWIFPKTKKSELEGLIQKVNEGSLKAVPPRVYRDQREPEKKSNYTVKSSLELNSDGEAIRLEKILDSLQRQVDNISKEIDMYKNMLKKNEPVEKEEIVEYVEEIVEEEEELKAPIKRLLKNNN